MILRVNSKVGVTQAEAGIGPVDSKVVLPKSPIKWKQRKLGLDAGPASLAPVFGVPCLYPIACPGQAFGIRR